MLTDPSGRPIKSGLDGWHDFKLIPASQAFEVKGLEEIAALVQAGGMPGDTPVFYATKESPGGGYPPVRIAVPLSVEELQAWQRGDRTVTADIIESLEDAYEDFMDQVRAGKVN